MRRIAFVGQSRYFLSSAFVGKNSHIFGIFIDISRDGDRTQLDEENAMKKLKDFAPDFIVYFRPETYPDFTKEVFKAWGLQSIGFLTEPVTSIGKKNTDNIQERRAYLLENISRCEVDSWICYSLELADFISSKIRVRSVQPLPVNDEIFQESQSLLNLEDQKIVFVGRLNPYRISYLDPIKQKFNPLVIDNGLDLGELGDLLKNKSVVGLNLHVGSMLTFENRVLMHMAQGHLVVSQILTPDFGILPGCEYLAFESPSELIQTLDLCQANPDWANWIRLRGAMFSENFRASLQWKKIIDTEIALK